MLGHLRHEIGHYYWYRLIENTELIEGFRALFGDERADYASGACGALCTQRWPMAGRTRSSRFYERSPVGGLRRNLGALHSHRRHGWTRRATPS